MERLIKPKKLNNGDTVATISLSGGASGEQEMRQWYDVSKKRLEDIWGLNVVETAHSMRGRQYIYQNPKERADDFMEALQNPSINAIFMNQGGDDAIRILPFIDMTILKNNPKIFLGFSDATIIHFMFLKAGITSFSGPNVLTTLSEPVELHEYTIRWMSKALFEPSPIGVIEPPFFYVNESIDWQNGLNIKREHKKNDGYEVLQGRGLVKGRLIGGSLGPLVYMIKGTNLFPDLLDWENTIVFLDSMSPYSSVTALVHMLRGLASSGALKNISGMIFSNIPQVEQASEIKKAILQVIHDEEHLDFPILFNVSFGHVAPMNVLPYGATAEINCEEKTLSIPESGVSD